jgi:hypothetical protein
MEMLNDSVYPNVEKFGISREVEYQLFYDANTKRFVCIKNEFYPLAPNEIYYILKKDIGEFTEGEIERITDYVGVPSKHEFDLNDIWLHGEFVEMLPTNDEIESAKALLRKAGYFTDNLWCNEDVQNRFKCDSETAQAILNTALTNEATMEQIHYAIGDAADFEGLETI